MTESLDRASDHATAGSVQVRDTVDGRAGRDAVWAALLVLVVLGSFLRIWQFGYNRSLWLDEATLAQGIVSRPLVKLITEPPMNEQRAPAGYLALVKLSARIFGDSEPALRLLSLISGLAALLLATWSAPSILRSPAARLCFVGLVSLSPVLIYYSTELKPYATDAAVSLLIVLAIMRHEHWRHGTLLLALVGAFATWLSYPSVFVLAGAGAVVLVQALTLRQWSVARRLAVAILCWIAAFAAHWTLSISPLLQRPTQARAWASGFPPEPFEVWPALLWVGESLAGFVYLSFRQLAPEGLASRREWFDTRNIALMLLVGTAIGLLVYRSRSRLFALSAPVLVALGASFLGLYPFRNRLLLFLTPLLYAVAASLAEPLWGKRAPWGHRAAVALTTVALIPFLILGGRRVVTPDNQADIKSALSFMAAHASPDDRIALSTWSGPAFGYYGHRYGFARSQVALSVPRSGKARRVLDELRHRGADGRVWFLFSHRLHEGRAWVYDLGRLAPVLELWEGDGALAALIQVDRKDGVIGGAVQE